MNISVVIKSFRKETIVNIVLLATWLHALFRQRVDDSNNGEPTHYDRNGHYYTLPQRTNNILEQFSRHLTRKERKRRGNHALRKTLKTMLTQTPPHLRIPRIRTT